MIRGYRSSRLTGVTLIAAVLGFAPGCTLFDDILPGTPFTPDQPVAEVTVVGKINIDRASGLETGCSAGRALFWGIARNTGDLDVDSVFIEIDALDANQRVIDTYRVNVFNGEITEITTTTTTTTTTTEEPIQIAGTSLAVDESGTFSVCTRLGFGSVAGTAYRTDFIVISEIENQ